MAQGNHIAHFFFTLSLLTLLLHFPHADSRTLVEQPEYTLLDVSASLQKTLHVFSQDYPPRNNQISATPIYPSPLSLQLYPRLSLYGPMHKDYKTLTESRLVRDSARVDSLITKLEVALRGISLSDLKPDSSESNQLRAEDLQAPVSSGTSQGSGEYFSRVGIGRPAKEFFMVLDTGSDVNWLQCDPCVDCYQQSDPIFDPSSSSTYSPLACASPQCSSLDTSACRDNKCLYQVAYGDGSYTVGDFVTETVSFGPSALTSVAIGCGHDNEGLFVGAAGLLGLGGGPLSLTSQIKATSLSYCLVDRDSGYSSTVDFNSPRPGNSVTAPLIKNNKLDTFYYVGMTGMSVGGRELSIPQSLFALSDGGSGGVIVDSGTAVTRLPTDAYNSLRDAFTQLTQNLPSAGGVALFDTCYDLSSFRGSVRVPTVSFHFTGGQVLDLAAKNYLIPVESSGIFCFAFAPTTSSMSIIGNIQQQGTRVHFDLAGSQVSFSQNSC
ncbi:hypothetical protein Ancab_038724 [Ancistrocladus abbreviatus]